MDKVNKRLSQIDFLRGVAILLVLFRHHAFFYPLQRIGWVGVDLFFVLSGFLVGSLIFSEYQKSQKFSIKIFLIRRGFKIYPLFYIFILCSILFVLSAKVLFGYSKEDFAEKIVAEIFFAQNYFEGLWGHTWSLAIEEHFYLSLSFIFYLFLWKKASILKRLHFVLIAILFIVLVLRCAHYYMNHDIDYRLHMYPTHLRIDSLIFGSLIAYYFLFKRVFIDTIIAKSKGYGLFALGMLLLIGTLSFDLFSPFMVTIGFSFLYVSFGLILVFFLYLPSFDNRFFRFINMTLFYRFISFIGRYSYAIYLFHMFLPSVFENSALFNFMSNEFRFLFYLCFSILIGIIFTRIVERPFLKIRDKFFPARGNNLSL